MEMGSARKREIRKVHTRENGKAAGTPFSEKSGVFQRMHVGGLSAVLLLLLLFLSMRSGSGLSMVLYGAGAALVVLLVLFRITARNDRTKLRFSRADGVFVFLWSVLLFIPAGSIDREVRSEMEKRNLAEYQALINGDGTLNLGYFKAFDAWFNDHFCGRNALMALNRCLMRNLYLKFSLHVHKDVYTGFSGWFFYSGDSALRNYHNLDRLSEKELSRTVDSLKKIQAICARRNKKLYVLICPDKHKVYGEFFPGTPKIRPDSLSRARQLEQSLKQNGIDVIYPLETLLEKKSENILYWKTDTHWNAMGAYFAYLDLMKVIRRNYPDIPLCSIQAVEKVQRARGDLTDLSLDMIGADVQWYPAPRFSGIYSGMQKEMDTRDAGCLRLMNPHGKYNLLILRDSFASALLPCLANSFHSVTALWSFQPPPGMVEDFPKFDIIIFECVERYLPGLINGIQQTRDLLEKGAK